MKKNILITILILSNLIFIVYAFVKADEASKSRIQADVQRQEAEKLRDEAVFLQAKALEAAEELTMQLEQCKLKNK